MATKLKEIREEMKLSQREVARRIKSSSAQISRFENGQKMSEDTIRDICRALEIKADYLLGLIDKH